MRAVAALPGAGRVRRRARAGHAALRPRCGRPRLDADGGGASRGARARRASRMARARAPAVDDAQPQALERGPGAARTRAASGSRAAPGLLVERRRAASIGPASVCGRCRRARPCPAATRSCARRRGGPRRERGPGGQPDRGRARRRRSRRARRGGTTVSERAVLRGAPARARGDLVARLEQGDVSLDEALALWERGEALYRACVERLDRAELRIEELRLGERHSR